VGVFGLLCAAMGIARHDDRTLGQLRERSGLWAYASIAKECCARTFHTGQQCRQGEWRYQGCGTLRALVSRRLPSFLVGLESDDFDLLSTLERSRHLPGLAACRWGGSPSFPAEPIRVAETASRRRHCARSCDPILGFTERDGANSRINLRLVLDSNDGGSRPKFAPTIRSHFISRRFTVRYVRTEFIPTPLRR
jgi:hypothetical protein